MDRETKGEEGIYTRKVGGEKVVKWQWMGGKE